MEITKEKFQAYENVRASGVTNMWNVRLVCELSGLTKDEAMYIMKEYRTLMETYPGVRK